MKKGLSIFLAVIMSLSMNFVVGAANPMISVAQVSGNRGDNIDVKVKISGNPGIISIRMFVKYDKDALKLIKASNGEIFNESTATFGDDIDANPYTLLWEDALSTEDHTDDGILVTLTFKILDTAAEGKSNIEILLDKGSTFNSNIEEVDFGISNGFVNITDEIVEPPKYDSPTIEVADTFAQAGETISVPITVYNNPGIIALKLGVEYDPKCLSLIEVIDGGLLGEKNYLFSNDINSNPYIMLWEDGLATENYIANGTVATLKFRVQDGASGNTKISIKCEADSTFDFDLNEVAFQTYDGNISIGKKPKLIAKAGSTTVIKNSFIYGLKPSLSQRDFEENYVEIQGDAHIEYSASVVTGATVTLVCNSTGKVVATYSIVIFGDINSDGKCDGRDAVIASCINANMLELTGLSPAAVAAADCNHDGVIDDSDVDIMIHAGTLLYAIEQGDNDSAEVASLTAQYFDLISQSPSKNTERGTITVSDVKASPGEKIKVKINLDRNPGIAAMKLNVKYDQSVLRLVKASNGNVFKNSAVTFGNDYSKVPYSIVYEDGLAVKNNSKTGTIVELTFKVLENADVKKTSVSVVCDKDSTFDIGLNDVEFDTQAGTIQISEKQKISFFEKIINFFEWIIRSISEIFSAR